ncbi:MAG: hypothetical protein GY849_14940 [Deltaproteobacteria bacterium]|nr:hypothetical protein [Deltaproteobacteria bacterium]
MRNVPVLAVIVVIYNILVFFFEGSLNIILWNVTLISGANWACSVSDLLLSLSVIFLFLEIAKSTRTSTATIVDHTLSLLLFIICLVEFIVVPQAGNSVFLLITLMCLLDVIAGFTITISTARRDIGLGAS